MSDLLGGIKLPVLASDPIDTPPSGKIFLYILGNAIKYKNSAGTLFTLSTGVTAEEVEDIVGNLISASSSKVTVVYNDSSNTLELDIVPSEISHQFLADVGSNTHAEIDQFLDNYIQAKNILWVNKNGNDSIYDGSEHTPFLTIKKAIDSVVSPSSTNLWVIKVGPGIYVEQELNVPPYVFIRGETIYSTIIEPTSNSQHVVNLSEGSEISFLTIRNSGAGYAGLHINDSGDFSQAHKVAIYDCGIGVKIVSSTKDTIFYGEYLEINGDFSVAVDCQATNGFLSYANLENYYVIANSGSPILHNMTGTGSKIQLIAGDVWGTGTDTAVKLSDGADFFTKAINFHDNGIGIHVANVGNPSKISVFAGFVSANYDVLVEHPGATGYITGTMDVEKVYVNPSAILSMTYTDRGTVGQVVLQDIYQGTRHDRLLNVTKTVRSGATVGLETGGLVTLVSGRTVEISSGTGIVLDASESYLKDLSWSTSQLTIPSNSEVYVYISNSGVVSQSLSEPNLKTTIQLARIASGASDLDFISQNAVQIVQYSNNSEQVLRDTIGSIFVNGAIVTENGAVDRSLDITDGIYYYGTNKIILANTSQLTFEAFYRDGSGGYSSLEDQTVVSNAKYDDGSGVLSDLTSLYYTKHILYGIGQIPDQKFFLVYGQAQYDLLLDAQSASLPTPPSKLSESVTRIASIIVRQGSDNIIEIRDERPRLGFSPSALSIPTAHGDLTGLESDDHVQYLLQNGSRSMTGSLDMGTNNVTNVGTVDGVDISSHSSRHLPNGADPLSTAAPTVDISRSSTNSTGIANSLSRSDHSHALNLIPILSSEVSDFTEATQDVVGSLLNSGAGISLNYNDASNSLTISSTITQYTDELAQDAVANSLVDSTNIDFTYTDASNQISADLSNTGVSAGSYGGTSLLNVTVDEKGRISSISNAGSLVIGDNFEEFSDATTFTTTANTNQSVSNFSTSLKQAGKYRIHLEWAWTISVTTSDAIFGIYVDGTLRDVEFRMETSDSTNQSVPFNWWTYVTFGSDQTHTLELRVRNEIAGPTITVPIVRAEMWRVN